MRSKAATSQAAFIRIASLWRTAAAPANASNRGKADQKSVEFRLSSAIAPQVNFGARQEYARRNDDHDGFGSAQRGQKLA
jgi:hypothetical protein